LEESGKRISTISCSAKKLPQKDTRNFTLKICKNIRVVDSKQCPSCSNIALQQISPEGNPRPISTANLRIK